MGAKGKGRRGAKGKTRGGSERTREWREKLVGRWCASEGVSGGVHLRVCQVVCV